MSRFLSEVKGFTPVIDILARELGLMPAVVYGIAWRYCQMEDRICSASRERIAEHANISTKTVERHLKKLCKAGYLEDLTPTWKHKPHIYADSGRAKIKGLLIAEVGKTESLTSETGETESPAGETESPTRSDTESNQGKTESLIRIPSYDSPYESKEGEKESEFPPEKAPIIEAIIEQTETHPDGFDLARETVAAREKAGGNYAVPPSAGGADPFADGPLDAFAILLAGITPVSLPTKERQSWARKLRQIAEHWTTEERPITAEIMERAIRAVPDSDIGWKTYTSPYAGNFETDIGPLLLGGGQTKQRPSSDPDKFIRARAMTLERLKQRDNR